MKPKTFVASSVEGLEIAYAVHQNLEHASEVTTWPHGVFRLSEYPLDSLVAKLRKSDFGVFVFSPDDIVSMRDTAQPSVRDNVLFELGLFIGHLGRERCFIVAPRGVPLHIATDLLGLITATFEPSRQDGNTIAALGPACHQIREAIKRQGAAGRDSSTSDSKESPRKDARSASDALQKDVAAVELFERHQRYRHPTAKFFFLAFDTSQKGNAVPCSARIAKRVHAFVHEKFSLLTGERGYPALRTDDTLHAMYWLAYDELAAGRLKVRGWKQAAEAIHDWTVHQFAHTSGQGTHGFAGEYWTDGKSIDLVLVTLLQGNHYRVEKRGEWVGEGMFDGTRYFGYYSFTTTAQGLAMWGTHEAVRQTDGTFHVKGVHRDTGEAFRVIWQRAPRE